MAAYTLPDKAYINKFIPKNKFFEKAIVNTKLKNEFVDQIQRINWKYKLAESTIGISKTDEVEEIQIFEIQLRQKLLPKNILKLIDKAIPYPILYEFVYDKDIAYGISYKDGQNYNYYFSWWNPEISFDISGVNLQKVYQKLIAVFISPDEEKQKDFQSLVSTDNQRKLLEKEIETLQNKLKKEKQFNRQVEINKMLLQKKKELQQLTA